MSGFLWNILIKIRSWSISQISVSGAGKKPGTQLAQILDVSRQVIVQDIALIRAKNIDVFSTNRGYVLNDKQEYSRILKVKHGDDEVEAELEQ